MNKKRTIFILGCMTALSPFSIDMYLPAFQNIADDFGTSVARVSLSLSSYFVGLSLGQLFYGPLLDRYGRKKPVYGGLLIYTVASLGCLFSRSADSLIAWRLVQALGGCAAGVGSMAMVRDLFSTRESAKVFSLLMLILGASPMLAPTTGGYLAAVFGWHSVFIVLAVMAILLAWAVWLLPESHAPDPTVSLGIIPIVKNFAAIVRNPRFYTYVMSGAIAFSGLFVYIAGSPTIFLGLYKVSGPAYGWIFAIIAAGFIGVSQLNVQLLKRYGNQQLLTVGFSLQTAVGLVFVLGTATGLFDLYSMVIMFFAYMSCYGLINPNSTALALAPFDRNAGSASAMLGFLQMGIGALISSSIGVFGIEDAMPITGIMAAGSTLGFLILTFGRRQIAHGNA